MLRRETEFSFWETERQKKLKLLLNSLYNVVCKQAKCACESEKIILSFFLSKNNRVPPICCRYWTNETNVSNIIKWYFNKRSTRACVNICSISKMLDSHFKNRNFFVVFSIWVLRCILLFWSVHMQFLVVFSFFRSKHISVTYLTAYLFWLTLFLAHRMWKTLDEHVHYTSMKWLQSHPIKCIKNQCMLL